MITKNTQATNIDLLSIIWKRKTIIAAITAISVIASFAISSLTAKIYKIETIIEPGSSFEKQFIATDYCTSKDISFKKVTIDTPQAIITKIKKGVFNKAIAEKYNIPTDTGQSLKFIPERLTDHAFDTNMIGISIEYPGREKGAEVLMELIELISEDYIEQTTQVKMLIGFEIDLLKKKAKSKNHAFNDKTLNENENRNIKEMNIEQNRIYNDIKELEMQKEMISPLVIVSEPQSSYLPVKPKTQRNMLLSFVISLFFGILVSLLFESYKRSDKE